MIAVIIIIGGAAYYYSTTRTTNTKTTVQTSTIGTGDIILTATGLGTLIPKEQVSFGFKNSGTVSEVLVSLGDQVKAGQVLARLDSSILELKYKQAEGNLAALSSPAAIASAAQAVQDAKQSFATARNDLEYLIGPDMLIAEEKVTATQQDLEISQGCAAAGRLGCQ